MRHCSGIRAAVRNLRQDCSSWQLCGRCAHPAVEGVGGCKAHGGCAEAPSEQSLLHGRILLPLCLQPCCCSLHLFWRCGCCGHHLQKPSVQMCTTASDAVRPKPDIPPKVTRFISQTCLFQCCLHLTHVWQTTICTSCPSLCFFSRCHSGGRPMQLPCSVRC